MDELKKDENLDKSFSEEECKKDEFEGGDIYTEKIRELEIEKAALIKGVLEKNLDYVVFKIKQKNSDDDINTLLDEFLKENPELIKESKKTVSTGALHNQSSQKKSEEIKRLVNNIIKNMS